MQRDEVVDIHTHNGNAHKEPMESKDCSTGSPANSKSLFAELFGKDVYDQLLRERNLRLLDQPFGRAMMMAEFCRGRDDTVGNSKSANKFGETAEDGIS